MNVSLTKRGATVTEKVLSLRLFIVNMACYGQPSFSLHGFSYARKLFLPSGGHHSNSWALLYYFEDEEFIAHKAEVCGSNLVCACKEVNIHEAHYLSPKNICCFISLGHGVKSLV